MTSRSNCSPPDISCMCRNARTYSIALGLPPVGTQSLCPFCGREWTLDSYVFTDGGGTRWIWTCETPPASDIKAANRLARTLLGIDAALQDLGLLNGATRGTC